jgi:uncharacterized protein YgbK (DUF1537 family)
MIGVIADDLTGAAELGALGQRRGLPAQVLLGGSPDPGRKLICVDTDSRSCSAQEAAARAAAAARQLQAAGARLIYKKVDSVLRGQVTAEIEAILLELKLRSALLVPANPSLGRIIRQGCYYVRGCAIAETEFAQDPEYPRRSSQVLELIGDSKTLPRAVVRQKGVLPETGIAIGETESVQDLRDWAKLHSPTRLFAGGAEFFGAVLDREQGSTKNEEATRAAQRGRRELFVSGTMSESSRRFVESAKSAGTRVIALPAAVASPGFDPEMLGPLASSAVQQFESRQRVILHVGLPKVEEALAAKKLSMHIANLAARVLRAVKMDRVYVEGGATAAQLVRSMGWTRLDVVDELALGVAVLEVPGNGLQLVIKPGSYVWPAEVQRLGV